MWKSETFFLFRELDRVIVLVSSPSGLVTFVVFVFDKIYEIGMCASQIFCLGSRT